MVDLSEFRRALSQLVCFIEVGSIYLLPDSKPKVIMPDEQSKSINILHLMLLLIWVVESVPLFSFSAVIFLMVGKFSITEWYTQFSNMLCWCLFSVYFFFIFGCESSL